MQSNKLSVKNDYVTQDSVYCYPETSILINKLNIHDKLLLEKKELGTEESGHSHITKLSLQELFNMYFESPPRLGKAFSSLTG